jgi:hypothetical protein
MVRGEEGLLGGRPTRRPVVDAADIPTLALDHA